MLRDGRVFGTLHQSDSAPADSADYESTRPVGLKTYAFRSSAQADLPENRHARNKAGIWE